MRRSWLRSATLVPLTVCALAACSRERSARSRAAAEVRSALGAFVQAWNRNDWDGVLAVYGDSAVVVSPLGPVRRVRAHPGKFLAPYVSADGRTLRPLRIERVEVRIPDPDHAITTGRYVLSGGGRPERAGWFSLVWVRKARGWRIVHDHTS